MADIFAKYMNQFNTDEIEKSKEEIQQNSNEYQEVPVGKYVVKVDQISCGHSKNSGNPMVTIWFKIIEGKYANSLIFYNGVFYQDFMRHNVAKLLSSLLDNPKTEAMVNLILKSSDVTEINDFCLDVHEEINGKLEYLLDYGEKKGYKTYKIESVYDAE